MAEGAVVEVPPELVQAALRAAGQRGRQVADVPVAAIAAEAGMSRSTLLRRLGGSRAALDDAVRAAGIDPGGRPVRVRALAAAAELISETGVGLITLDAIAVRAGCSVDSLFAVFGSRDELLAAVFERYSPIIDIEDVLTAGQADLTATVAHVYRRFTEALVREPRVTPALMAEALARPASPAVATILRLNAPRMLGVIGQWLASEIQAVRIREMPLALLVHQFIGPLLMHMMLRPAAAGTGTELGDLPGIDETCDLFAEAFVRSVGTP